MPAGPKNWDFPQSDPPLAKLLDNKREGNFGMALIGTVDGSGRGEIVEFNDTSWPSRSGESLTKSGWLFPSLR
jgi:hypothetical protein